MRTAIVGAGIAGLACAERLRAGGVEVVAFDKGRGPGGRMSSRRVATSLGEASFDHGAQYFTARDEGFRACVARWKALGLAAPWPDAGPAAWVGSPSMNAPVRAMAQGLDTRASMRIEALHRRGNAWRLAGDGFADAQDFDAVVVAVPAEQAPALLRPWDETLAARAEAARSSPCWTVMAAFAERLPHDPDILRETGPIGWAARDSAKPGRSGPESWVIQAGPDWSVAHLEDAAEGATDALLTAFAHALGAGPLPAPIQIAAHRWRYAKCTTAPDGPTWNAGLKLGVCGDWLLGPRVEAAWLSGDRLAQTMLESL